MERREFLKLTLGLTAAAGAIAATATAIQAAPMLPESNDASPRGKGTETAAKAEAAKDKSAAGDTDISSRHWRRRRYWRRAHRRYWRRRRWWRRRRVIYY